MVSLAGQSFGKETPYQTQIGLLARQDIAVAIGTRLFHISHRRWQFSVFSSDLFSSSPFETGLIFLKTDIFITL